MDVSLEILLSKHASWQGLEVEYGYDAGTKRTPADYDVGADGWAWQRRLQDVPHPRHFPKLRSLSIDYRAFTPAAVARLLSSFSASPALDILKLSWVPRAFTAGKDDGFGWAQLRRMDIVFDCELRCLVEIVSQLNAVTTSTFLYGQFLAPQEDSANAVVSSPTPRTLPHLTDLTLNEGTLVVLDHITAPELFFLNVTAEIQLPRLCPFIVRSGCGDTLRQLRLGVFIRRYAQELTDSQALLLELLELLPNLSSLQLEGLTHPEALTILGWFTSPRLGCPALESLTLRRVDFESIGKRAKKARVAVPKYIRLVTSIGGMLESRQAFFSTALSRIRLFVDDKLLSASLFDPGLQNALDRLMRLSEGGLDLDVCYQRWYQKGPKAHPLRGESVSFFHDQPCVVSEW